MSSNLTRAQKVELVSLLEERQRRADSIKYLTVYESFYDWQMMFVAATAKFFECCLCAANQIGKTYLGTEIDAMHLLGEYPDDWKGHRFDFPPLCWCLGYSMEKTRDLLQNAIFGELNNGRFAGGLIPADRIETTSHGRHDYQSATGTPDAVRTVKVKHKLGTSIIQFWSYTQGQHAIMGDVVDHVHIDEEPKDQSIRPQVLTRTINGDKGKGGRIIYTFTPENGRTDLVVKFMDDPSPSQFFMKKGWNDAPHMTKEKCERILAQYPEHQRAMRSEGEPMLGHGRIYDIGDDFILCDPFEIPDHWYVLNAMDFGWDHPQSHVQLAFDRDNGMTYVTRAFKQSKLSANDAWGSVKDWNEGIPVAWPADGLQERDNTGNKAKPYVSAGFRMLPNAAVWPDVPDGKGGMKSGGNAVDTGIQVINAAIRQGKFKVFRGLIDFMDEFRQYHRSEPTIQNPMGKIVKVRDDILDGVRYGVMMQRYAIIKGETNRVKKVHIPTPIRAMGRRR